MQYSISQLLDIAKAGFNEIFGEFSFWCMGEIVGYKKGKKAIFLECIEYSATGSVLAKCTACVFNSWAMQEFFTSTSLTETSIVGQKILFRGHFSLYEDRISIIVDELSSSYTLGQLQQSQSVIRDILVQEGVLTNNQNTTLGYPPYNIAIISSDNSDGLQDFLTIMDNSGYPYFHTLYTAGVHGNDAKVSVYKALQKVYGDIKNGTIYSAVCIIRGGGDTAGILRQNDIDIARGVCHMPVPVIIAIGHTKDKAILDEVAYASANTPTAAASIFIECYTNLGDEILEIFSLIQDSVRKKLTSYVSDIETLNKTILLSVQNIIGSLEKKIDTSWMIIQTYHPNNILKKGYALVRQNNIMLDNDRIPTVGKSIEIETDKTIINALVESVATKE